MQIPLLLNTWNTLQSLCSVALDATIVFPFMMLLCLITGRKNQREAMARCSRLFANIGLITGLVGLVLIIARGIVERIILPHYLEHLVPAPFSPLSPVWLPITSTALVWFVGLVLLFFARHFSTPIYRTAFLDMDDFTARQLWKVGRIAAIAAVLAGIAFFFTIILRNWPFLGLPEQMTQEDVLGVLIKHAWQLLCAAFMPAGAIAVLTFYLQLPPLSSLQANERAKDDNNGAIPGTAHDPYPLSDVEKVVLRMCTAFALAGAAFQFLDASFMAFSHQASLGVGLHSLLMRFGPFFMTGISLACWGLIFAKPKRQQLTLALIPVLFILLTAGLKF